MARPRTTNGMKYAALIRHELVLVACLRCMKAMGVSSIGEIPPECWHPLDGVEFDHDPALGFDPKFHRVKFLEPKCPDHHLIKTKRDLSEIARMKRRAEKFRLHFKAMQLKRPGAPRELTGSIPPRPFDTRFIRRLNGKTEKRT